MSFFLLPSPCPYPQSTYRGRVEIGGVYLPSQLEHTPVMVDKVKGGGRAPVNPPHSLIWNIRQKVAVATLCSLCSYPSMVGKGLGGPGSLGWSWLSVHRRTVSGTVVVSITGAMLHRQSRKSLGLVNITEMKNRPSEYVEKLGIAMVWKTECCHGLKNCVLPWFGYSVGCVISYFSTQEIHAGYWISNTAG